MQLLLLNALILSQVLLCQWQKFSSSSVEVREISNLSLDFAAFFSSYLEIFYYFFITPFYYFDFSDPSIQEWFLYDQMDESSA